VGLQGGYLWQRPVAWMLRHELEFLRLYWTGQYRPIHGGAQSKSGRSGEQSFIPIDERLKPSQTQDA